MQAVDPSTLRDVLIILAALTAIVVQILGAVRNGRPSPPHEASFEGIRTRIESLERGLDAANARLASHEEKLSRQIGALHERINDVFGQLKEITGVISVHMREDRR